MTSLSLFTHEEPGNGAKVTAVRGGAENQAWPTADTKDGDLRLHQGASLVVQVVKNLPAVQEIWAQSLVWEDPLEKEMATHYSIFAWRILWTEELDRLQSTGLQESDTT